MMASIEKASSSSCVNIGKETFAFIFKKWISIFPECIVTWLLAFGITAAANQWTVRQTIWGFIDKVWEMLLLSMTGIGGMNINLVVWYISSMLICMMILYPLLRKYYSFTIYIFIPLSALLILGYLSKNYGTPRGPTKWLGFIYKGTIRGFAEIGIGVLLYHLVQKIRSYSFNKYGRIMISCIEWCSYGIVIYFMYLQGANKYDYFFIALLALAISLSFSEKGIDSRLFCNKWVYMLGRFSVPLYFSHIFYAQCLNMFLSENYSAKSRFAIYLTISFITAFLVMQFCKWLRHKAPNIKRGFKKLVLEDDI